MSPSPTGLRSVQGAPAATTEQSLPPFGIVLTANTPDADVFDLDPGRLRGLSLQHKIVVLRGFRRVSAEDLQSYGEGWGGVLRWNFGYVFDVKVHEQPKNYLFTPGNVPYHWDGAFADVVPSFQLFQCLAAPPPGAGGETLFCDTTAVVNKLPSDVRARWADLKIDYDSEKVAHYGGQITSPLLGRHPTTGAETIRFAEPFNEGTVKLNLLTVAVHGKSPEESSPLLQEIAERLYEPDVVYAHSWKMGDFLVADNHALLHGRRPFQAHAPRHLQRIHIL